MHFESPAAWLWLALGWYRLHRLRAAFFIWRSTQRQDTALANTGNLGEVPSYSILVHIIPRKLGHELPGGLPRISARLSCNCPRIAQPRPIEVHRISAESSIKALRWFVRQAQWDCLSNALNSPVIRAYSRRGTAQDRREALPIPWALITGWEERVCDPTAPLTTKAVLGAALLATHASLRFGDLQRVDFSSLSLSTSALHGTCFATKTTTHGQPFAVTLAGITGRNLSSCWMLHWLAALHSLVTPHLQQEEAPDFLWLSTALDAQALDELAPASYCTALLCLRYVATLPWRVAGSGLLPGEARQLTLHSMKSTLLAAAAQLRLAKEIRLAQGHHRDSARLYSRNDTFEA